MYKKIIKRTFSIIIALVLILQCLQISVFAAEIEKVYTFEASNGETVEYCLDYIGQPFQNINGEKIYILLPLDSLKITDEKEIAILNKSIENSEQTSFCYNVQPNSAPSTYFDLTTLPITQNSRAYTQFMTFEAGNSFDTRVLKVHPNHPKVRIKTANLEKQKLFDNKKVIVKIKYYDEESKSWYELHKSGKIDCTHADGYPFTKLSIINYLRVTMMKADSVVWFDLNIWTALG